MLFIYLSIGKLWKWQKTVKDHSTAQTIPGSTNSEIKGKQNIAILHNKDASLGWSRKEWNRILAGGIYSEFQHTLESPAHESLWILVKGWQRHQYPVQWQAFVMVNLKANTFLGQCLCVCIYRLYFMWLSERFNYRYPLPQINEHYNV